MVIFKKYARYVYYPVGETTLIFVVKISGKFVNSSHVVLVDDWQCQDNRDEFSTLDLLIPTSHLSHSTFVTVF